MFIIYFTSNKVTKGSTLYLSWYIGTVGLTAKVCPYHLCRSPHGDSSQCRFLQHLSPSREYQATWEKNHQVKCNVFHASSSLHLCSRKPRYKLLTLSWNTRFLQDYMNIVISTDCGCKANLPASQSWNCCPQALPSWQRRHLPLLNQAQCNPINKALYRLLAGSQLSCGPLPLTSTCWYGNFQIWNCHLIPSPRGDTGLE